MSENSNSPKLETFSMSPQSPPPPLIRLPSPDMTIKMESLPQIQIRHSWSSSPNSHSLSFTSTSKRTPMSISSISHSTSTSISTMSALSTSPAVQSAQTFIPTPMAYRSPPSLPRIQTPDPLSVTIHLPSPPTQKKTDFVLSTPPKRRKSEGLSAYPTPARSGSRDDSQGYEDTEGKRRDLDPRYWSPAPPPIFKHENGHVSYAEERYDGNGNEGGRPRLSIHPYAARPDMRYFSAVAPRAPNVFEQGRGSSPASAISGGLPNFKAPRKRADDSQVALLLEVFERTSYPTTEERDHLARRLGMTSRSVQIWFQNRRRAVKVEYQSAIQRAEADVVRSSPSTYHGRRGLAQPYTHLEQVFWGRPQSPRAVPSYHPPIPHTVGETRREVHGTRY
ncbi:hypothetical protein M231_04761 [Tremella mesenterica]|uniref:Homeobox domain-containing protein n=1 Tax=Tremella mesenterica TaxID=5217 RepID=A0A4Q1BJX3_TREME|nr:hypothetical protein M231_04761 [Tremella mesenterica]